MTTDDLSPEMTDQDRLLLVFDYLGPLALFSLLASRREFVKWHAKQGLLLSAAVTAAWVVFKLLRFLLGYVWPIFGELFWAAVWMAVIGVLLLMLLCVTRALEGERFKIPVLGDLADRF